MKFARPIQAVAAALGFASVFPAAHAGALEIAAVLRNEAALAGAHDIEIRNGLAYIAGKGFTRRALPPGGVFPYAPGAGGSLAIVDVKMPGAPRLIWGASNPLSLEDAETIQLLASDRLLVGTRDLILFDVRQPALPRLLAAVKERPRVDTINGFARMGQTLFAANKAGQIIAVDVSTQDSITVLGSRETRSQGELASPHDVALSGKLLVVVSPEGFGANSAPGRLGVYRVADPATGHVLPVARWVLLGRLEHPKLAGANRVVTRGAFAFVGSSLAISTKRQDDFRNNVSVVDLGDPSRPRLVSSVDFPDPRGPNGLEISGTTVFAAGGQTVQALNVRDPADPRVTGVLTAPEAFPGGADDAHDLVYSDGHLFVTAQNSHSLVVVRADAGLSNSTIPRDGPQASHHPDAVPNTHAPGDVDKPELVPFIVANPATLPGIVVDESAATLVGKWQYSTHTPPYVGVGYLHDQKDGKGGKSVTFTPTLPSPGRYEVRLSHCYNVRRATNAPVTIHHADGETTVRINEQETPEHARLFRSIGTFRFEAGRAGWVRISTDGTDGKYVIADAVQWLPVPETSK